MCLCGFFKWCDLCRPSGEPGRSDLKEYGRSMTFAPEEMRYVAEAFAAGPPARAAYRKHKAEMDEQYRVKP